MWITADVKYPPRFLQFMSYINLLRVLFIAEYQITTVIIECGKLITGAALLPIDNWKGSFSSERFRTMTTIFPLGFRKAVD